MHATIIETTASRRTFFAGTAAIATAPIQAFPAPECGELDSLIEMHRLAKVAQRQAEEIEAAIYNGSDRPDHPAIKSSEIHPRHYPLRFKECDRCGLEAIMEKDRERIARWFAFFTTDDDGNVIPAAQQTLDERDKRLAANAAEEQKLIALFEERAEPYRRWSAASGLDAASEEVDRLTEESCSLEDRVMAFVPQTLPDILAKAQFLEDEFGSTLSATVANKLISDLVLIGRRS